MLRYLFISFLCAGLASCDGWQDRGDEGSVTVSVPQGFDPVPIPASNELTIRKVTLGRKLFFDPILSRDNSVSCASCHDPDRAFSDVVSLSAGVDGRLGLRNSPSIVNVAYVRELFWDGGALTLENQVLAPLQDHNEMDSNLEEILSRLEQDPVYRELFAEAFGDTPNVRTLTQAIAAYERTIVSGGSRFDSFKAGKENALSESEQLGLRLFEGSAGCANCHSGFLLTTFEYINNGIAHTLADSGRARITLDPRDSGRFKVPSLRNVGITAPYMHDGRFKTLAEVIEHYNSGGEQVDGKDQRIKPLSLTEQEKTALVDFLSALTDEEVNEGVN